VLDALFEQISGVQYRKYAVLADLAVSSKCSGGRGVQGWSVPPGLSLHITCEVSAGQGMGW